MGAGGAPRPDLRLCALLKIQWPVVWLVRISYSVCYTSTVRLHATPPDVPAGTPTLDTQKPKGPPVMAPQHNSDPRGVHEMDGLQQKCSQ